MKLEVKWMGHTAGMKKMKNFIMRFFRGMVKEIFNLEDLSVNDRIIIKVTLK
jgi:hypothetical protein